MRIEVIVFRIKDQRTVCFKECLRVPVRFLDKSKVHLADALFGRIKSHAELGVQQKSLLRILANVANPMRSACDYACEFKCKVSGSRGRGRIAMTAVGRADLGRPANIQMTFFLAEEVNASLWHCLWQIGIVIWLHTHQLFELQL